MKRQSQLNLDPSDTQTKKSCPTIIQEDVTKSIYEQFIRNIKSQQCLPYYQDSITEDNDISQIQSQFSPFRNSPFPDQLQHDSKIDLRIINQKGTDFDCQKVQSVELSIEDASYRSGSLKNRSHRNSEQLIEEPRSARKFKKQEQKQSPHDQNYRHNDIKQEVLNVLLAGAEDTGKSKFKQCFKGRYRKADEPHIKSRTRQIRYENIMDQNLLNKRNNVCFIDLPGFACNQEDKYLRQIQQYATTQWLNFYARPDEDKRIHCCLYFMRGPRIKHSDINMIKKLSSMFNLIPIIAKSDHYKIDQILEIKDQFHRQIQAAGHTELYDLKEFYLLKFGTDKINEVLNSNFGKIPPFAIASSTDRQKPQSPKFVRQYPWGKVYIQNQQHTDFKRLCDLLTSDVRVHLLAKIVPLGKRAQQSAEEVFAERRNNGNQSSINHSFIQKLKDVFIITTLIGGLIGGIWFYPKIKEKF